MRSRPHAKRKPNAGQPRNRRNRRLLSVRSALILWIALMVAIGAAYSLGLLGRPVPLIVSGAVGGFVVAVKFLDDLID